MVLGRAGSGGQLQKVATEGGRPVGPLSSEFSRDSPSPPSTCPLVVWEVEREVVVLVLGSGGRAEDTAAASCPSSPLLMEDGEEAESLAGWVAKVGRSSPSHSSRSSCPF